MLRSLTVVTDACRSGDPVTPDAQILAPRAAPGESTDPRRWLTLVILLSSPPPQQKGTDMRLALFDATGRIGGHLLNWAVDAGHPVHVLLPAGVCSAWPLTPLSRA